MRNNLAWTFVAVLGAACSAGSPAPTGAGAAGAAATAGSGNTQAGGAGGATSGGSSSGGTNAGASGTGTSGNSNGGSAGAAGSGLAGSAGLGGGAAGVGAGGSAAGTSGAAGASGTGAGGAAGAAGSAGSGGGTASFKCPGGATYPKPVFGAATLAGVPPPEAGFDMNNYANVEGPVWIGDALYFSEMLGGSGPPPSRILKMTEAGTVTVALSETSGPDGKGPGSNGLAVDASGQLYAAVHKDGSVDKVNLTTGVLTPVASMYNGARFDSPNDLAIASNGWIYFSDPDFQAPSTRPQPTTHLYRVSPTGTVTADGTIGQNQLIMAPNGVTLSLDEATLFVSGNSIYKFPVNADGSLGMGTQLVAAAGDGMVLDCAGNLYVAGNNQSTVQVYDGTGKIVGTITLPSGAGTTTNVAFGGATHQTLYITAMGNDGQRGVFKFAMNLPGMPY